MKITSKILAMATLSVVGLAACSDQNKEQKQVQKQFIDPANMDTTVKPGDNFFLYANGTWLKNTAIPGDKTRWGSFDELRDKTNKDVKALLEESIQYAGKDQSAKAKIGQLYKSGMDTAAIEKAGIEPLNPLLEAIEKMSSVDDIMAFVTKCYVSGNQTILRGWISPDDKNVTKMIAQFFQGGLGLPSKDYYTEQDSATAAIRTAYINYIQSILELKGQDAATAANNAKIIFNIENELAKASLTPVEQRDPHRLYNKFAVDELTKTTPGINWRQVLEQLHIKGEDTIIVGMPAYYKKLGQMLTSLPIDAWKQYFTFHTISDFSPFLSKAFSDAHFNFYNKTLSGQKEQTPRWERVMHIVDGSVGDLLGQLYVDKHFKPEAKQRMIELVDNLQSTFHERITNLEWMSDATKTKAIAKLNTFLKKIGYPDKWKNYDALTFDDNYVNNIMKAAAFNHDYEVSKLGKPVDKTEWLMTPNTVNAYYNPAFNEIVFPAAILQFPFFDFEADDAINYGGIGAVIGHEMTHGFDDQGCQYDADGNLKNWWTEEDAKRFAERTNIVKDQFDAYTILDGLHVNGALTLGENIADLGGVTIAYEAFKKTKQGQSNETIDGFTPDQRFFLSWAQVWRGKATPERARQLLKTDPHSPSEWRGNGPLSMFQPFYDAFNVQEGDKMYVPVEKRARIW